MKKSAIALVLMCSGVAHAKEEAESLLFLPFWYAGVSLNHGHYSGAQNDLRERTGINHIIDGLHLGYQVNPYLSAEVEYQYLGNAGNQAVEGELSGSYRQLVSALRVGHALTERTYGYVKLGGAGWMASDGHGEGLAGVMGMGASYDVNDHLSLRLEYQYTDSIGNECLGEASHHMGSVGVSYVFGRSEPVIVEKVREVVVEREVEKVITKEQTVVLNERSQLMFAHNSSTLVSTKPLASIVAQMSTQPLSMVVTGYTDSTGAEKYNRWLSERRAQKVADYFIKSGIAPSRVQVIGLGESNPIADNTTEEGRAMNRRVEIMLIPQHAEASF